MNTLRNLRIGCRCLMAKDFVQAVLNMRRRIFKQPINQSQTLKMALLGIRVTDMEFEAIYPTEETCWLCPDHKVGMILASNYLFPETQSWFCEDCWPGYTHIMDIIRDKRLYLLAPPKHFDIVAFQASIDACARSLSAIFDGVSLAFTEIGNVLRQAWDSIVNAVRHVIVAIDKSEIVKSKPRAHRKRINQRRVHVYRRRIETQI
jgi:hypothetical protein